VRTHGRRKGGKGSLAPLDFENFSKKVVFLVSNGKKQILPLLATPRKIVEKSPIGPVVNLYYQTSTRL